MKTKNDVTNSLLNHYSPTYIACKDLTLKTLLLVFRLTNLIKKCEQFNKFKTVFFFLLISYSYT